MIIIFLIFLIFIKDSFTNVQIHKVAKGGNVILPCESAITNDIFESFHWHKLFLNSSLKPLNLEDPRKQLYAQYNLVFKKVLLEDAGEYTCEFLEDLEDNFEYKKETNKFKKTHITYKLHIEGTPVNESDTKHADEHFVIIKAKLNEKIILPCEGIHLDFNDLKWETNALTKDDFDPPTFRKKFGLFSDPRFKALRGYNLEIQNVQPEDAGNYSCLATELYTKDIQSIASHELVVLDPSHDVCTTAAARLSCGINSDCYPYEDKPKCSCRKQYSGRPPYCKSTCNHDHNSTCDHGQNIPLITCTSPWCKDLCKRTCPSEDLCMIQDYKFTCMCGKSYLGPINDKCWVDCGPVSCTALSIGSLVVLFILFLVAIIFMIKMRRSEKKKLQEDKMNMKMNYEVNASFTGT